MKYIHKTNFLKTIQICFFGLLIASATFFSSCDKVKNPYLPQYVDIDTTLLPEGITLEDYKASSWLDWTPNLNSLPNVLIEDFTGHKCVNCPLAAIDARAIETAHEGRVFVASIHAGPEGSTGFQSTSGSLFSHDFTNSNGLAISTEISDGGFAGNPSGTINRKTFGGQIFQGNTSWSGFTTTILANNLLINLQAQTNYFTETRGLFLHTEIDIKEPSLVDTSQIYQVVYLIEDSLVAPQITPSSWGFPSDIDVNYVHRDIMRGCIDNQPMGRQITSAFKVDKNGNVLTGNKYYINYSYKLPSQYNADIMHLLIYVYDNTTKEILQVIRQKVKE